MSEFNCLLKYAVQTAENLMVSNFCSKGSLRNAMLVGFMVLLTGCGQISSVRSFSTAYSTPELGDKVKLRVITFGMVRGIPNSDCVDFRLPGAGVMVVGRDGFANRNGERLDMALKDDGNAPGVRSELLITAGQPIAFHYIGQQCYNMFSFVPQIGVEYQLEATSAYKCSVSLRQRVVGEAKTSSVRLNDSKLCRVMDNF
ncbi:hypothetical protein L6218_13375 [Pseudomonas syringae pv. syringae]|uniref:hypothetical protein n=1 Tax=Pseudomonas TaxID=286 RepID=UPI001E6240BD|nr:hypothetical protein [Pseudomonas syringae]MCH5499360.1 hypothetical protein [Pseudomonas syringae pv. syringae]MCH5525505.1 hypothetical protein [Pseudomonas syringae pv. syringae]MCH5560450.1 hypothetical protein [Pseudomonas syringae pv. syringae]MCH5565538.1 hypothetical protein [Pseudomonas syringae pv. syringae]MCH5580768.1 hypothetical protein [Pseudomonas syringae pv. syringae]